MIVVGLFFAVVGGIAIREVDGEQTRASKRGRYVGMTFVGIGFVILVWGVFDWPGRLLGPLLYFVGSVMLLILILSDGTS